MSEPVVKKVALRIQFWIIVLIFASAGFLGCGSKEPSLSKAAYAFKKEIDETLRNLIPLFVEPVVKGDVKATDTILKKLFVDAHRKGRPLTFSIVILDKHGVTLTYRYPQKACHLTSALNYSDYSVVAQALEEHRIVQGRLFLQGGTTLYAICAPLLRDKIVNGLLVLGIPAVRISDTFGVSEKEFLALNFNE